MATATVKWFNDVKGFGFITPDESGDDLCAPGTLKEGHKTGFEVVQNPKGRQASNGH